LIEKPIKTLQYVFDLMAENGVLDTMDTAALAEEYASYIIYLYFEQNFLKESPSFRVKRSLPVRGSVCTEPVSVGFLINCESCNWPTRAEACWLWP
jgi:hypothetical protein